MNLGLWGGVLNSEVSVKWGCGNSLLGRWGGGGGGGGGGSVHMVHV